MDVQLCFSPSVVCTQDLSALTLTLTGGGGLSDPGLGHTAVVPGGVRDTLPAEGGWAGDQEKERKHTKKTRGRE